MKTTGFAKSPHGFVLMILGFEVSYAHFPEALGVSWRRRIIFGNSHWYLRENWSRFYVKRGKKLGRFFFTKISEASPF